MTTHRVLRSVVTGMMLLVLAAPAIAGPAPKTTPNVLQKAGAVSALLPTAKLVRGTGKNQTINDAKKGDEVVWNDVVRTEKGGRARITLTDQSILSVGSQSELKIIKHDAKSQQTALELTYGRVRAEVSAITRGGGSFELRTPTAVAGVIGTDYGVESGVGESTFVCLSGNVKIGSSDPKVGGGVECHAGQTVSVAQGKAPTAPKPASIQQMQNLIQDTEPAGIAVLTPNSALPGAAVDSAAAGKMTGVTSASVSATDVHVTMASGATVTSVPVHITVDANAKPGPRTISFNKTGGGAVATAVFNVIALPSQQAQQGDPKAQYHTTFDTERQSAVAGLQAAVTAAQQASDQASQQVTQANSQLQPPVDTTQVTSNLAAQVAAVQTAVNNAVTNDGQAETTAQSSFDSQYATAYTALLQRVPSGTPDQTFNNAIAAIFQSVNQSLLNTLQSNQTSVTTAQQNAVAQIGQIGQNELQLIASTATAQQPPTPKTNITDTLVEVGNSVSFDGSSSTAGPGGSISATNWTLCDPSYKPSQVGVLLPPKTSMCPVANVQGISSVSTGSTFTVPTCSLNPGQYIVRLTVTGSSGSQGAMDVRFTVNAPSYDDPYTILTKLAAAYSSLQPNQFMNFFDPAQFSGYASLQEAVQKTFPELSSMSINLLPAQTTITCSNSAGDAVVSDTWQQKYSFLGSPVVLSQSENLTVRFTRTPGKGWGIVSLQGDNGTVQGVPPGPVKVSSALPDLTISGITAGSSTSRFSAASSARGGSRSAAAAAASSTTPAIATGAVTVTATVANTGSAAFSGSTDVLFALIGPTGTLATTDVTFSQGLAAGGNTTVTGTLTVPTNLVGATVSVVATVDPGCAANESSCANNAFTQAFTVGGIDLSLSNFSINESLTPPPVLSGSSGFAFMTVTNAASSFTSSTVTDVVSCFLNFNTPSKGSVLLGTSTPLEGIPPGGSTNVSLNFTFPSGHAGSDSVTCTVSDPLDTNTSNNSQSINLTVIGIPNFVVTNATFQGHTDPVTGVNSIQVGETPTLLITLANTGDGSPSGNVTVTGTCQPCNNNNPPTGTVPAPAAGTSVVISAPVVFNQPPGAYVGTIAVTTAITPATIGPNFTKNFDLVDFQVAPESAILSPAQQVRSGGSGQILFNVLETTNLSTDQIPIAMSYNVTGITGVTTSGPPSLSPGAAGTMTVNVPSSVTGGSGTATPTGTNFGQSRSFNQPITVYTASCQDNTFPGNSASQPLNMTVGVQQVINFQLTGTFTGSAALAPVPTTGFTQSLDLTSASPNTPFNLTITPTQGFTTVQTVNVDATIPNTNPLDVITCPLYVLATAKPNLLFPATGAVTPTNGRTLGNGDPLLSGEGHIFNVTVNNNGSTASTNGVMVHLCMNASSCPAFGAPSGSGVYSAPLPSIPAGGSATVQIQTVAPDPAPNGVLAIAASIDPDPAGELSTTDNILSPNASFGSSDWALVVNPASPAGAVGSSASNPLVLTPTTGDSGTLTIGVTQSAASSATVPIANTISLEQAVTSRRMFMNSLSPSTFSGPTTTTNVTLTASSNPVAADGIYLVQVVGHLPAVAGQPPSTAPGRQVTMYVQVNNSGGNSPYPAVQISSDQNNVIGGPMPASSPTAVQLNGPLPATVNLTATPILSGVPCTSLSTCPGQTDITFTPDTSLNASTFQIGGLPYLSPSPLTVSAAVNDSGSLIIGSANVTATLSSVQNTAPAPIINRPPSPGSNTVTIEYNTADLFISAPACSKIPVGQALSNFTVTWLPTNGFNVPTLSWQWFDITGSNPIPSSVLSLSSSSGTSSLTSNTYPSVVENITNSSNGSMTSLYTALFAVTISNAAGQATKYFPLSFDLTSGTTNLCGGPVAAKIGGSAGPQSRVNGAWTKFVSGHSGGVASAVPDLQLSVADVTYTPSIPKAGDNVSVRFRVTNAGNANASKVPIVLQVNGVTVASDVFDVAAGKSTLAGLQWNNARLAHPVVASAVKAQLVVDPAHTTPQRTLLYKSAPLAHFTLAGTVAGGGVGAQPVASQRISLGIPEAACASFQFASGAGGKCGSGDVEISVENLAAGRYSMTARNGIADLGLSTSAKGANYGTQSPLVAGHTYAVQLSGGKVGLLTIQAVRNPKQLAKVAGSRFDKSGKALRGIGGDSGAVETGDVSAAKPVSSTAQVFFDLAFQTP